MRVSKKTAEKLKLSQPGRSKYGVRQDEEGKQKRRVHGILFSSGKEARRYCELLLLRDAGKIQQLVTQPRIVLLAHGGQKVGHYVADFAYIEDGKTVFEDCKGFQTALYKWKKKHCAAQGIEIRET